MAVRGDWVLAHRCDRPVPTGRLTSDFSEKTETGVGLISGPVLHVEWQGYCRSGSLSGSPRKKETALALFLPSLTEAKKLTVK